MKPVLQIIDAELRYGGRPVLSQVQLRVDPGQWIALVGPNASGKTTLLRCAAGRLPPTHGEVLLAGVPLYPLSTNRVLPGYCSPPEDLPRFLSLRQCMQVYAAAHRLAAIPEATIALCAELGLAEHEQKLVEQVSLGTRQKLAIVLALMTAPSLLLLDEVFNGLDFRSARVLKRHLGMLVEHQGLSILLATHALDVVGSCCNAAVLIDSGRLVRGWDTAQLDALHGIRELEDALAAALDAPVSRSGP
jgi:ABC-2 type transport system ATP-binding protein